MSARLEHMARDLATWSRVRTAIDGVAPMLKLDDAVKPGTITYTVSVEEVPAVVRMHHDTWRRVAKIADGQAAPFPSLAGL